MDFTQIMQRYTRLRERYEQGEIDADSFEKQVNGMIYKDEEGRYWQIGVQSGLWYYYDGTSWVQDDLVEEIEAVEEAQTPDEEEIELAAIDEIFPVDEEEEIDDDPSPFDKAFEEQLASQFAESSDSQVFDLFNDKDIFDSILKDKGLDDEDDLLSAPAEEVEGLKEHLDVTQPVSIESLMGEGTAISAESNNEELGFLFDEEEDDFPDVQEGTDMDLAAVLGAFNQPESMEDEVIPTDVRAVGENEVVTGELNMPVEPLTEEAILALMDEPFEESSAFGSPTEDQDEGSEEPSLVWDLEPNAFQPFEGEIPEMEENPTMEEAEDDFSMEDLVYDSQQEYLEATQPVPTGVEYYEETEAEDAPFEIPLQPEADMDRVPGEVSLPVGETIQSSQPIPSKRKLPLWVILLIVFVGVFVIVITFLVGWNLLRSMTGGSSSLLPSTSEATPISVDDPNTHYESFEDSSSGWPELNDYNTGVTGYSSGFYYLYSIVPEIPTIATVKSVYGDVTIDVETTQLNEHSETLSTYGVMCRVQENGDGYSFRITNNGQFVIEKYENGVFYPLNGWKYSDVIKANKEVNRNHIEVSCQGSNLTFTVNGHLLDYVVDSSFAEGKVGFVAQAGDAEHETEIHYDELFLIKP